MKIYCAAPISGKSGEDVWSYYENITAVLRNMGYEVLSPMTGKEYLRLEKHLKAEGYEGPVSTAKAIYSRDIWMVEQADIVYMNLKGAERVSIGCMMELERAHSKGKHTVVVMEEGNIHEHAFVHEATDVRFGEVNQALNYLKQLIIKN